MSSAVKDTSYILGKNQQTLQLLDNLAYNSANIWSFEQKGFLPDFEKMVY